ncbi:MAG: mucoidy inhibitor MuiA family protein, partial [Chloroflexi bacterium]|nr:mucoidy inhibitor MuiA family protein [Chloroflexota bacterium]
MEIQAPIRAASVYTDRALVTRQALVTLPPGLTELVIDHIPTTLVEESVRASGAGQALILGLEVSTQYHTQAPEESLADLDREIEALQDQDQALQDRQATLEAQLSYLQGLVEHNDQLTRGIGRGRMGVSECENLLQFIVTGLDAAHQERQSIDGQRRELARQLEALCQRRSDLAGPPKPQERRRIAVTVEAQQETAFQLTVDYVVRNASWQPLYDLRLAGQQVNVTYRGQVTQRTGEPWSAVVLTLSTARPSVSAVLPELEPWYLDTYRPMDRMEKRRA